MENNRKLKKWQKVQTVNVLNCGDHYKLHEDDVTTPGGKLVKYYVVRKLQYAAIIPITEDGEIYLVKQHRYTTNEITIELPTGNTDGEDPFIAAKRELEEETGLASDDWEPVGRIQEANGLAEIYGHVFIARNVRAIENPKTDPLDQDAFEIVKLSLSEMKQMIADGTIDDAATVTSFAKALLQGRFKDYE
jgi:8-oxo-dGTP pyrophosphatase MutT (NUDIX family)